MLHFAAVALSETNDQPKQRGGLYDGAGKVQRGQELSVERVMN